MTEAELLSDIDPVLLRQVDPNVSEATAQARVYLAGPMRGIAEFNFPAFVAAAALLRSSGYEVWSPAEHDRANGFDPTGLTGDEDLSAYGFSLRDALVRDISEVAQSDFVCLLNGWEQSMGAKAERAFALSLGLTVDTLEEFLRADSMTEQEFLQGVYDEIHPHRACSNCDDRKCMSCIFRDPHDECRDDCPDCCPAGSEAKVALSQGRDDEVRVTSSTGGQKGKKLARYDLIPVHPLWDVAELYGRGARKYEDRGWERGYAWSLSYAALMRHLQQFWDRESFDKETGSPHLAAVVFHALALLEFSATHPEFDDRPGR